MNFFGDGDGFVRAKVRNVFLARILNVIKGVRILSECVKFLNDN